jgi:hypothetical protein
MRKQLDAEMPTTGADRRRGFGWYLWLMVMSFFVVSVGTGYAIWNRKPVQSTTKVSKPIAEEAPPMGNSNQASLESKNNGQNDLPKKANNNIAASNVAKDARREIKHSNHFGEQLSSNEITGNALTKRKESLLPLATNDSGKQLQEFIETSLAKSDEILPAIEASDALEQFGMASFPVGFTAPSIAVITQFQKNSKRMAIEASYMRSVDNPASGVGLGLLIGNSLKNSKFNLQFGLGYIFVQQPLNVELAGYQYDGSGAVSEEVVSYGTNLDAFDRFSANSNAVVRTSRQSGLNLHYLSVPMRLSYSFNNRLSLKMGIDAAVLLNAKSDYVEGGVFERLSLTNKGLSIDAEMSGGSGTSNHYAVAPFDLVSTVGLEYRITNRLSLASQFRYGLIDVLPKNKTADFNRLLQLSISYHLPNKR